MQKTFLLNSIFILGKNQSKSHQCMSKILEERPQLYKKIQTK